MNSSMAPRIRVGVWLPFGKGSHWSGEGIARTVEFILGGFAEDPDISERFTFVFFVSKWTVGEIRRSLSSNVDPRLTIEIHAIPNAHYDLSDFFSLGRTGLSTTLKRLDLVSKKGKGRKIGPAALLGGFLLFARSGHVSLEADLTALAEFKDLRGVQFSEDVLRAESVVERTQKSWDQDFDNDGRFHLTASQFLKLRSNQRRPRWHILTAPLAIFSRPMRMALLAIEALQLVACALRSTADLGVDVWWVPSPTAPVSTLLRGPKVVNFWDYVVAEYGYWWDPASINNILARVRLAMRDADRIVTQSNYNRDMHLSNSIGIDRDKVDVVRLGPPDYSKYIPGYSQEHVRTVETKEASASIIRGYARAHMRMARLTGKYEYAENGNQYERLCNFDFAAKAYIVVSTQDRPYKNLGMAIDVLSHLVHQEKLDVYLFLTAKTKLNVRSSRSTLPDQGRSPRGVQGVVGRRVLEEGLQDRFFNMSRVPNRVHAALYHCARATYHPSLTEGGVGSYPFMEGMSVGCPGFISDGEYAREGVTLHPHYMEIAVSSFDVEDVANKLKLAIVDSDELAKSQKDIYKAHSDWGWRQVAGAYAGVFETVR